MADESKNREIIEVHFKYLIADEWQYWCVIHGRKDYKLTCIQAIERAIQQAPSLWNVKVADGRLVYLDGTEVEAFDELKYPKEVAEWLLNYKNQEESKLNDFGEVSAEQHDGRRVDIYIGTRYIKQFDKFINSNDDGFRVTVGDRKNIERLLKQYSPVIDRIDNAKIVDYGSLAVATPNGITDVYHFSTGLKTFLNVMYQLECRTQENVLINITECGDEVVNIILSCFKGTNVKLYLAREVFIEDKLLHRIDCYINGNKVVDDIEAYNLMCELNESGKMSDGL